MSEPATRHTQGATRPRGEALQEQLREAGADQVETTLLDTRKHLNAWLPVLAQGQGQVAADGAARGVG